MRCHSSRFFCPLLIAFGALLHIAPAAAQSASPVSKWEFEAHIGGAMASNPTAGSSSLPPAGDLLPVPVSGPNVGPSRRVSSWFFGDGALLMTQASSSFRFVLPITPIDPALKAPDVRRRSGVAFGFRLARAITPSLSAEFSLDAHQGRLALSDKFLDAFETSATSYTTTFNSIFPGAPFGSSASSDTTAHDNVGTQILIAGAVNDRMAHGQKLEPYLTVGGGVAAPRGDAPDALLTGTLSLTSLSGGVGTQEIDKVKVRVKTAAAPVFIVGGGLKCGLSARTGFRADVRAHIGRDTTRLLLDATPSSVTNLGGFSVLFPGNPSLVFGRSGPLIPSLSGPAIQDFETFKGTGTRVNVNISAGYFLRF